MGGAVSSIIDEAEKESPEKATLAKDTLMVFTDLADLYLESLERKVINEDDLLGVPIRIKQPLESTASNCLLGNEVRLECDVTTNEEALAKALEVEYKRKCTPNSAKGIAAVLHMALEHLFKEPLQPARTIKSFVTTGTEGVALRVDVSLYAYTFNSEALSSLTKNILSVAVVYTQLDIEEFGEAAMKESVDLCYSAASDEVRKAIYGDMLALKGIKEDRRDSGVKDEIPATPTKNAIPVTPTKTDTPMQDDAPTTPTQSDFPIKNDIPVTPTKSDTPVQNDTPMKIDTPMKDDTPTDNVTPLKEEGVVMNDGGVKADNLARYDSVMQSDAVKHSRHDSVLSN